MKTATQNLENDHEHILQLIEVMHNMAKEKSGSADDIETVITIIRNYADGFHHAKEENLLFPAMEKKGFSSEQGPIAVMLHDHELGRNFVKGMMEGLAQYSNGSQQALDVIYDNMLRYCQLLQNHIAKENNILFRMADNALSIGEQQQLLKEFEEIEQSEAYGANISTYITAINNLKVLYNYKATVND